MKQKSVVNLETAERQLDRTHSFFSRIDNKVSALLAISTGQFAIVALNLRSDDFLQIYIQVAFLIFFILASFSIYWLYLATYPNLKGGVRSLTFFAEIARMKEQDFVSTYSSLDEDALKEDIIRQIHRNSEIVNSKFDNLKRATTAIIISSIPWLVLILYSSILHSKAVTP
jgi:Family of unknown function (DUF5706)